MTLWSPDTCACVIEISDSGPTKGQPVGYVKQCEFHQNSNHAAVINENRNKNRSEKAASDAIGGAEVGFEMSGNDAARKVTIILPQGANKAAADAAVAAYPKVDTKIV